MRPTSVCAPVANTTARPVPAATVVALKRRLFRSASGVVSSSTTSARFEIGSDSPVSAASSTRRSTVEMSRASAGTRCPALTSMMSPGTTVCASMSRSCPVRTTDARGVSSSSSASMARRARHSVRKPMSVLMTRTAAIAAASSRSPRIRETTAATMRRTTTTPVSWSRRMASAEMGGGGDTRFGP